MAPRAIPRRPRQSHSRRMRAPLLAAAALLACLLLPQPCAAHPRLIWGGIPSDSAAASSSPPSWLLSLRDRSHAVALCAEAEGRRGALRRFAGACARPAHGRLAPLGGLRFRPGGADDAARAAQLLQLLRAFPARILEFAERDAPVSLADAPPEAPPAATSSSTSSLAPSAPGPARGVQRCPRELHALDRLDQASLPLDGAYAAPWSPSAGKALSGAGVRVYVLDTGVRATHAELRGKVQPGIDLVEADAASAIGWRDANGHGTHVAALVAGTRFGASKGAAIVPVRVLDAAGEAAWSHVLAGMDWVASHHANAGGAAVAVLSLAGGRSLAAERAAAALAAAGVLPVVAAGNAGGDACAASPGGGASLVVGAAAADDARAAFSNYGVCVDVFAPGTDVLSASASSDEATKTATGTSSAAPMAAAAAALFLEAAPGASAAEVKAAVAAAASAGVLAGATLGEGSPNRMLGVTALGAAADARAAAMAAMMAAGAAANDTPPRWTLALRPGVACAAAAAAPWGAWEQCDAPCGWGRQRRSRAQGAACAAPANQTRTCYAGACSEL